MLDSFLFDSWNDLLWIFLMSILIYPTLLLILRIFGKRSLANMNMFDFIITVAYGNTLASILVTQSISYADGTLVIFMLALLQFLVSKIQTRIELFRKITQAKPVFLYYQGEFDEEVIRQQRFQQADLRMAVRKQGFVSFQQIDALILEGDGTISAVKKGDDTSLQSVSDVKWTKKSGKADQ